MESTALLVGQEVLVGQEIQVNLPSTLGLKEVVIGEEAFIIVEAPRVIINVEGVDIVVLDSLVDKMSTNLKLCLIGRFVSFHLLIEMVIKWVSQRWKLKGSVMVSTMLGGMFYFKFKVIEDMTMVMVGSWS